MSKLNFSLIALVLAAGAGFLILSKPNEAAETNPNTPQSDISTVVLNFDGDTYVHTWNPIAGADSYSVQWAQGETQIGVITTTNTSITLPSFRGNKIYWITVTPLKEGQASGNPQVFRILTTVKSPPDNVPGFTPVSLFSFNTPNLTTNVNPCWPAYQGADSYDVEVFDDAGNFLARPVSNNPSYPNTRVEMTVPNMVYRVIVYAMKGGVPVGIVHMHDYRYTTITT